MDLKAIYGNSQRGVTLLELLIVVTIVAIISAFAYPSYMEHVVSAKRTVAASALLQVADRQQQFFMDNKQYANDLTDLGLAANPLVVSDDGMPAEAGDGDSVYSISLSNVTATTYTVTAAPLHGQLSRDTACGSLSITQAGVKGSSAGGDDCW
ncbi:MAG: type IV pilin protein [Woeseiaceae bacterium]|jgi:type IV pilus assembly protein PilE